MTSFGVLRDVRFTSLNLFRWRHWLKNSGYKTKLQYQQPAERKENVTSPFNPSYSRSVKNNFGRIFIKLICKYFLKNHQFIKIFNKNAIKLSHSCIPKLWSKINGHKKNILQPKPTETQKSCNCFVTENWPIILLDYIWHQILYINLL